MIVDVLLVASMYDLKVSPAGMVSFAYTYVFVGSPRTLVLMRYVAFVLNSSFLALSKYSP